MAWSGRLSFVKESVEIPIYMDSVEKRNLTLFTKELITLVPSGLKAYPYQAAQLDIRETYESLPAGTPTSDGYLVAALITSIPSEHHRELFAAMSDEYRLQIAKEWLGRSLEIGKLYYEEPNIVY